MIVKGQIVGQTTDEGAGFVGFRYGVVVAAGPVQFKVQWEHGQRSIYFQPYGGGCLRVLSGKSVIEAIKVLQAQGYL